MKYWLVMICLLGASCSPPPQTPAATSGETRPADGHRVVIAMHVEPTSLVSRPLVASSASPAAPMYMFNATLTQVDERGAPLAQLAERLPQLNTSSWQLLADGRMETTYTLKPGASWHDGTPLTAEDFVFAWQVYTTPEIGAAQAPPVSLMDQVSAPDSRTVLIRWTQTYTEADAVAGGRYGLPPLPRHILEAPFTQVDVHAFVNHPYWSAGFVGSGPYRLDRWEQGAYIDASGFPTYVEGPPNIDRIRLVAIGDPSAALATVLSGDVDLAVDFVLGTEQASVLKQQWPKGTVYSVPSTSRYVAAQFKTEYVNPQALLDVRVRRALLHSIDRAAMSRALLDGEEAVADTLVGPQVEYFAAADQAIRKYAFDPRVGQEMMLEAGFSKPGAFYMDADGQPLTLDLWAFAGAPGDSEVAILADGWKQAGFEISPYLIPAARSQDLELLSTHPGLRIDQTPFDGDTPLAKTSAARIATAANRWTGSNRGGYFNPEFERLLKVFQTALERDERNRAVVGAFKLLSEELPLLPIYYSPRYLAVAGPLRGVRTGPRDVAWNDVTRWAWAP